MSSARDQVHALAARLSELSALEPRIDIGLVGLAAGALCALRSALDFDYDDSRGRAPDLDHFGEEFRDTLRRFSRGDELPRAWLGGFHFVSALFRLSALMDRLHKPPFAPWPEPEDEFRRRVREDVNRIKHATSNKGGYFAHPAEPLESRMDDALATADAIAKRLEERLL